MAWFQPNPHLGKSTSDLERDIDATADEIDERRRQGEPTRDLDAQLGQIGDAYGSNN
ncbi:hypothetical protein [Actinokineospora enzanensis]|uniref:hypothetical protein n=1 Tax=Actinokineospora enzanensis TaxID=155975 RepID=UPI00037D12C1|nr:hypothetical protein [Actinokineospora enzanensis]